MVAVPCANVLPSPRIRHELTFRDPRHGCGGGAKLNLIIGLSLSALTVSTVRREKVHFHFAFVAYRKDCCSNPAIDSMMFT